MKTKVRELREKRANIWEQMKALRDAAEGRAFTAEEEQSWDRMTRDIEDLGSQIEREEQLDDIERSLDADPIPDPNEDEPGAGGDGGEGESRQLREAFVRYLRHGRAALSEAEHRALESTNPQLGGYLVPPQQFVRTLLQAVDDVVHIRSRATKFEVTQAESLGVPSLDADPADADWTAELLTGNADDSMRFGKRELTPHPLAKRIKVSNKLIRQAAIDPEALVRARFAYKFGVTEEKAFLLGDGANQPLGLFTASNDGIPTSRDKTIGTQTDITADGLIDVKHELKGQYWANAEWLFHRTAIRNIRKLKDQHDQYVWAPGIAGGAPNTILDSPYMVSEYVPSTFTTGKYVAIYGDFSYYWIVDALDMQVQRLVELYAETNQTGFIFRRELDGMPVLAEAFVRGKLA